MFRVRPIFLKFLLSVGLIAAGFTYFSTSHQARPRVMLVEPAQTWVFVVGILEWKDSKHFGAFPKTNRKDLELVNFFSSQGVPADHIVYLQDKAATTETINTEFARFLQRPSAGDMAFVYYCGHGFQDKEEIRFASYDVAPNVPSWSVRSLIETIDADFTGSRVFIAADCCNSGALVDEINRRPRRISFAGLSSTTATANSTEKWTFTEALLEGLQGEPWTDHDGDQRVTLQELAQTVQADMAAAESQVSLFTQTGDFVQTLPLSRAMAKSHARIGERIYVSPYNELYPGRIVAAQKDAFKVHFIGLGDEYDAWIKTGQFRPYEKRKYTVGQHVQVEWKEQWYPAVILKVRGTSHFIHYDRYSTQWNEWVPLSRIRTTE